MQNLRNNIHKIQDWCNESFYFKLRYKLGYSGIIRIGFQISETVSPIDLGLSIIKRLVLQKKES